jgi:hypothetical protein
MSVYGELDVLFFPKVLNPLFAIEFLSRAKSQLLSALIRPDRPPQVDLFNLRAPPNTVPFRSFDVNHFWCGAVFV